jgi:DNA-binding GntR family transcriptional regulator
VQGGIDNLGYKRFFDALIAGRLKFGQTLRQEELAEILGLSLSPMRETTTLLEAEGMVQVRRKLGITVFRLDVNFIGETFQFRGMLEREGLRKFASMVPQGWVADMRARHLEVIELVREAAVPDLFRAPVRELESAFHESFIAAYDNRQIEMVYARLAQKMYIIRLHNMVAVGPANTEKSMREHIAIIDALGSRDTDGAIAALEAHLQGVLHRVLTT